MLLYAQLSRGSIRPNLLTVAVDIQRGREFHRAQDRAISRLAGKCRRHRLVQSRSLLPDIRTAEMHKQQERKEKSMHFFPLLFYFNYYLL